MITVNECFDISNIFCVSNIFDISNILDIYIYIYNIFDISKIFSISNRFYISYIFDIYIAIIYWIYQIYGNMVKSFLILFLKLIQVGITLYYLILPYITLYYFIVMSMLEGLHAGLRGDTKKHNGHTKGEFVNRKSQIVII